MIGKVDRCQTADNGRYGDAYQPNDQGHERPSTPRWWGYIHRQYPPVQPNPIHQLLTPAAFRMHIGKHHQIALFLARAPNIRRHLALALLQIPQAHKILEVAHLAVSVHQRLERLIQTFFVYGHRNGALPCPASSTITPLTRRKDNCSLYAVKLIGPSNRTCIMISLSLVFSIMNSLKVYRSNTRYP